MPYRPLSTGPSIHRIRRTGDRSGFAFSDRSSSGSSSESSFIHAFVVTLDGRDLRVFGSAGQQRTAAIALRMLEAATVTERRGLAPMFLLDDPFAELDARRSARILSLLEREGMGGGQTVLAVPRDSDIPAELTRLERFRIAGGVMTRADAA